MFFSTPGSGKTSRRPAIQSPGGAKGGQFGSLWRVQSIRRSDTCGPRGREQTRDAILRDSYRYVGTKAFKKKAFICSFDSSHGGGIALLKRDGISALDERGQGNRKIRVRQASERPAEHISELSPGTPSDHLGTRPNSLGRQLSNTTRAPRSRIRPDSGDRRQPTSREATWREFQVWLCFQSDSLGGSTIQG
ncbi:uncharacterized protein LOC115265710 [Aedes albopictus]|uniref:Uncharacterized protein n=1 Tax=Aedes albopictus TaxID=7160 RepID=A0ABM1YET4_AEDAL